MKIGDRDFDFASQTYVIGILNITPDSFSDGGLYLDPARALDRALEMEREGADIIDIGAESSRPGSLPVSEEEELRRLLPVLKKIAPRLKCPLSVDTRKASVARVALSEGASMINDISALRDPEMANVVSYAKVPIILMHMRGEPETMQIDVSYKDVVGEIVVSLKERITLAVSGGIPREKILIDPGIGFGKRFEDNLAILLGLKEFRVLECPIVFGASRKSFVRQWVGEEPDALLKGSLGVALLAQAGGASLLRVHDVRETKESIRLGGR